MLSVLLRFTDSDYTFDIFKLFFYLIQFGSLLNQKLVSLVSEVFAEDVNFTKEIVCPEEILKLQCQLADPTRVQTMRYIRIQHKNISEIYEEVVTIRLSTPARVVIISWYNDTINILSTEGSSIISANESKLIVQISVNSFFESRGDSVMFRCTINGEGFTEVLKQNLTVKEEDTGKFC